MPQHAHGMARDSVHLELQILRRMEVPFETVDVLTDDLLRAGMKEYSQVSSHRHSRKGYVCMLSGFHDKSAELDQSARCFADAWAWTGFPAHHVSPCCWYGIQAEKSKSVARRLNN